MARNHGYTNQFQAWGGDFWRVAHCVTFQYPVNNPTPENRALVRRFFDVFADVIPCSRCGLHFKSYMEESPLTDAVLTNRDSLSRWLHNIHNNVNRSIGKAEVSYEDAARFYLHDYWGGRLPRTPYPPMTTLEKIGIALGVCVIGMGVVAATLRTSRTK